MFKTGFVINQYNKRFVSHKKNCMFKYAAYYRNSLIKCVFKSGGYYFFKNPVFSVQAFGGQKVVNNFMMLYIGTAVISRFYLISSIGIFNNSPS